VFKKEFDVIGVNIAKFQKINTSNALITKISVKFRNKDSILSEANKRDLFEISKRMIYLNCLIYNVLNGLIYIYH
jgi:hypothetical protein